MLSSDPQLAPLAGYPTRRVETPRDADGNRASLGVAGAYSISYSYTQRNQLASIGNFANFTYDASGNMTNRTGQWIYENGANFVYDDLNRVTQIEQEHAWAVFARSHYQYDRVGREEAVWRDEDSGRGERFEYEPNDQVKKAWYRAQNVWTTTPTNEVKNEEFTCTPDKLNRASVASNGVVTNYAAPNGMNQYPSVGNAAIGYDDHFNIASYHGATYIYDAQNRLVGGSMQATYDGLGRCVRRVTSAGTRLYTYDGWKPILEWNGNGSWQAWNIYGAGPDEILARNDATYGPTIYKLDKQGNVMALLDGSSNVVEKYFYDAYGNRFLFTGREYIAELGIYDYRHRMYHPGLGRFLQSDPTGFDAGDMNLFRYCGDDPVDRSDPTGLFDMWSNLTKFFNGNPSMNVVLAAWNADLIRGLNIAQGSADSSTQNAKNRGVNVHWDITNRIRLVRNVTKRDNHKLVTMRGKPVAAGTRKDFSVTGEDAHNVTAHLSIDTQIATISDTKLTRWQVVNKEYENVQALFDWSSYGDGGYLARTAFRD